MESIMLNKLVQYIKDHGHNAYAMNGSILAEEVSVKCANLEVSINWVTIAPNLNAVRNWLGY